MLFPLLLVGMLVFLFWSSRSQQKKQDTAISQLKKGDRVVTQSGLIGRLVEIEPRYAQIASRHQPTIATRNRGLPLLVDHRDRVDQGL